VRCIVGVSFCPFLDCLLFFSFYFCGVFPPPLFYFFTLFSSTSSVSGACVLVCLCVCVGVCGCMCVCVCVCIHLNDIVEFLFDRLGVFLTCS